MRAGVSLIAVCLLAGSLAAAFPVTENSLDQGGIVFICPVLKPTAEEEKLADQAGRNRPVLGYSVQVNDGPTYGLSHDEAFEFEGLDLQSKHLVKIFHSGKRIESFWFRFTDLDSETVCLAIKLSYHTWLLYASEGSESECDCRKW